MMQKIELIFLPAPGIGHLVSILDFAKRLIDQDNRVSITILCIKFQFTPFGDSYIRSILASQPRIQFIDLPEVDPPIQELFKSPEYYIYSFIDSLRPHVKSILQTILSSSDSSTIFRLVLDFFCMSMVDVGKELGIPSYMFLTTNAGFLSFMLTIPKRRINDMFKDSDPELLIPGLTNPVPARVLPDAAFNEDGGYFSYYKLAQWFTDAKGIILNTFSQLEQHVIDSLSDTKIPPIYAVGPVIDLKGQPNPILDQAQHDKIMKWLDSQPKSSVVFLCFGSMGSFGPSQVREIAIALQQSGVRFLWALRSPPTEDNPNRIFPAGFMEWMEDMGMICGWAPQGEVLAHQAIGGFVSHCGWNSILESLWFGVPILTWPIYAEQQLNAFRLVKELELAIELSLDHRSGSDLVLAEEIEKGLRNLMCRDSDVYEKVQKMKDFARKAVLNGGSSFISTGELIQDMIGKN